MLRPLLARTAPSAALAPLAALLLAGCSNGLTALGDTALIPGDTDVADTDTDVETDTDVDTDTDIPVPNNAPTADAGPDQSSLTGAVIALDGNGSFDPDGDELDYEWTMLTNPPGWAGSIINANRADAQFFADAPGPYTVELLVDDGEFTATDTMEVFVEEPNEVPVANAGSDQYVDQGTTVQLNGSNSYDPDDDPLDFSWVIIDGPVGTGAVLSSPTSPLPTFTADLSGVYSIELIVTDTAGNASAPDVVRVTAQEVDDGGGSSGDCFSCVAAQAQHRFSTGSAAMIPGFVLFPAFLIARRRRD
jgi:hypothetical protein